MGEKLTTDLRFRNQRKLTKLTPVDFPQKYCYEKSLISGLISRDDLGTS
jgi:hypothetical protein